MQYWFLPSVEMSFCLQDTAVCDIFLFIAVIVDHVLLNILKAIWHNIVNSLIDPLPNMRARLKEKGKRHL
ncbi:MAG: hypothetical protein AB7U98_06260 [Candidatus Nitrosocosmicus sp.]|nr:hypothetical protein [Candidatus Nitrosocosmicus sp.]